MNRHRPFSTTARFRAWVACLGLALLAALLPAPARAAHGISIDGRLKYPADFSHFAYTSPKAVKGGELLLHDLGSFDKMNPFTLKGSAPAGLDDLVFETLAVASLDEPFAEYGLLAGDIELAADRLSVTFTLRPEARFSDGVPVTAGDVAFSLATFKSDAVHPFYQSYFRDITEARVEGERTITFLFARRNRELHLIAAQLPILPRHYYEKHTFGEEGMTPPVGSGPYLVEQVIPGKRITYRRNPDYWGRDLPVRRYQYNFDRITYKYFKDQIVSLEAFKAGEFDVMPVNIAKQWARDMTGPKFASGELQKEMFPHHNNAGMQGFVFNTRRWFFADRRTRLAINYAFDFEWTNRALFFDQYRRCDSYFSNSFLAATGVPQGDELALLQPYRDRLPEEVFTTPPTPISTRPPASLRANLRRAKKLLAAAGWRMADGHLVDGQGRPFAFEILLVSPSFERVMAPFARNLERLGIQVSYRTIDPALYQRRLQRFDFDMVVTVFGQSQSPGNEQRDYWHSASADREGSRNLAGVKDPVVDALVDRIVYAENGDELITACHALDRVLWYGYYVVPNWYLAGHRIAFRDRFARPETLPLYYSPFQLLMTWWQRPAAARP